MTSTNDAEEHMRMDCRSAEMQGEDMRGSTRTWCDWFPLLQWNVENEETAMTRTY